MTLGTMLLEDGGVLDKRSRVWLHDGIGREAKFKDPGDLARRWFRCQDAMASAQHAIHEALCAGTDHHEACAVLLSALKE
jgi:hypothetical protein